jgi:hypothetical protein
MAKFISVTPVLPSADIERDTAWYEKHTGFKVYFADKMYAVLFRENIFIHLQWHADTDDDPLLGGSVIRILVSEVKPFFDEFVERGTVQQDKLVLNTPWQTHEFGFYDLNKNAIFIVEGL